MIKTREEIVERYKKWHDRVTKQYYVTNTLTKEQFDATHSKCWRDMDAELIEAGYKQPPQPSEVEKIRARLDALERKVIT